MALIVSFFLGQQSTVDRNDINSIYRDAEARARKYTYGIESDRRRRRDHEDLVDEFRQLRRSNRLQRYEEEETLEMERSRRIRERYEEERLINEDREERLRKGLQDANYREQYLSSQNRLINRFDEYIEPRKNYNRRDQKNLPPENYPINREYDRYLRDEDVSSDEPIDVDSFDDGDSGWK